MRCYYPIALDVRGRLGVVVGGGEVAERKVRVLLQCGARVRVVSPALTRGLRALVRRGRVAYRAGRFRPADVRRAALVIGATDDEAVNTQIAGAARRARALVNIVDRPALCSFIAPAVVSRGPLTISITTDGKSPAMAKRIRQELEGAYGPAHGRFIEWLGRVRPSVQRQVPDAAGRQRVFDQLVASDAMRLVAAGRYQMARARVRAIVSQVQQGDGRP